MMEGANILSLKINMLSSPFVLLKYLLKKNRYQYLNFKVDKPISDNRTDHWYITNMYVHISDTYSCYYVCM